MRESNLLGINCLLGRGMKENENSAFAAPKRIEKRNGFIHQVALDNLEAKF